METFIIVFVVLSLMGSVMWVMPTKREKFLMKLRLQARQEGFQVQLVRLTAPRALGNMDEESTNVAAYRLPRTNLAKGEGALIKPWQVFRVNALANEGLPEGWCWKIGERQLNTAQLACLNQRIANLPEDVWAIESSPVHVTVYWKERSGEDKLTVLKQELQQLLAEKF